LFLVTVRLIVHTSFVYLILPLRWIHVEILLFTYGYGLMITGNWRLFSCSTWSAEMSDDQFLESLCNTSLSADFSHYLV